MHLGFFRDLIDQSAKLSVANTPISWLFGITMQARGLPAQNFPSHTACCTDFVNKSSRSSDFPYFLRLSLHRDYPLTSLPGKQTQS
jgi:hypothetical protein